MVALQLSGHTSLSERLLDWPYEVLEALRHTIVDPQLDDQRRSLLRDHGLINPATGALTPAAEVVVDLLVHESWQLGDEVQEVLADWPQHRVGEILDVGCSTAWTLRQLHQPSPCRRVGVDLDAEALALGARLANSEQQEIELLQASAHNLPLEDSSFDCVICRNAITYTHQRTTISELARVLRPGGLIFLRFENYRYDLGVILESRGLRAKCCRVRDLIFGILQSVAGLQPQPGARCGPGRVFGGVSRISSLLRRHGCTVRRIADSRRCPRLLGRANQTWLVATKEGALAPTAQTELDARLDRA